MTSHFSIEDARKLAHDHRSLGNAKTAMCIHELVERIIETEAALHDALRINGDLAKRLVSSDRRSAA